MGTTKFNSVLGVTSIASRGSRSIPTSLHATETGISVDLIGHLARIQTLPYSSTTALDKSFFVITSYGWNHLVFTNSARAPSDWLLEWKGCVF